MSITLLPHVPTLYDLDSLSDEYVAAAEAAMESAKADLRAAVEASSALHREPDWPNLRRMDEYSRATARIEQARSRLQHMEKHVSAACYFMADLDGAARYWETHRKWEEQRLASIRRASGAKS